MSDILIRGMEMPKDEAVALYIYPDGRAKLWRPQALVGHEFEAVPVQPHEDLIDRGYAIATACSGRIRTLPTTEDGENWIRVEEVRESIKNAPTIIPASEKGEA